jgi:hypothetical protein
MIVSFPDEAACTICLSIELLIELDNFCHVSRDIHVVIYKIV